MNYLPYLLILIGAALRLIPHPANFAPIAAIALFGGIYLSRKHALWLPLTAMVMSDFFIGFDSWESRATVYGSFLLIGLIGLLVRKKKNFATVVGGTVLGSVIFFLITNFAYFYPTVMYSHDLGGIIASYINALPFFRNTLLGDLFYVGVFAGSYELVRLWQTKKQQAGSKTNIQI